VEDPAQRVNRYGKGVRNERAINRLGSDCDGYHSLGWRKDLPMDGKPPWRLSVAVGEQQVLLAAGDVHFGQHHTDGHNALVGTQMTTGTRLRGQAWGTESEDRYGNRRLAVFPGESGISHAFSFTMQRRYESMVTFQQELG